MYAARAPVSLIKIRDQVSGTSTVEILQGVPNGFLALLGFIFDDNTALAGPHALEHMDFPITDPESLFTALESFYDAVKSDPAAFAALMDMPDVQADVFNQLKEISDQAKAQKEMRMDGIVHQFEQQKQMRRQAQRDAERDMQKRMQGPQAVSPKQDLKEEPKKPDRQAEARREQKPEPESDWAEEVDDQLEALEIAQDMNETPDYTADEPSGLDLADLTLMNAQQQDKEKEPQPEAQTKPVDPAYAWDRLTNNFNDRTASQDMKGGTKANPEPYQSNLLRDRFDQAASASHEIEHVKRLDNQPTYNDQLKIKLNQELNLGMRAKPQELNPSMGTPLN